MSLQAKYFPVQWLPDADPSWQTNPGVLTEVYNMVPSSRGTLVNYCMAPSDNVKMVTTISSANTPIHSQILKLTTSTNGNTRFFVGTTGAVYEVSTAGANTSVYASGNNEYSFDAFGDSIIMCLGDPGGTNIPTFPVKISTGAYSTAFTDLTGTVTPPQAAICVVQSNFLLLFNVYDGSSIWNADGWNCSGLGNINSWTAVTNLAGGSPANLSTQANNGRLLATPGPIRAAVKQRDTVVVYKEDSMYVMSYVGNPYTWAARLISDKAGQLSANGTAVVNGVHYFLHRTGVYRFDGSFPQNIGVGRVNRFLGDWMADNNTWRKPGIKAVVVEKENLIIWYLAKSDAASYSLTGGGGTVGCTAALAYNYATDKFGWIDNTWEDRLQSAVNFGCPVQCTRSELMLHFGATQPNIALPLGWGAQSSVNTLRQARIGEHAQGAATSCRYVTGDIGDDYVNTLITEVKPRLVVGDDDLQSAVCYVDGKASQADYYTGEGLAMSATATGNGSAYSGMRVYTVTGTDRRTILTGDYMAFDYLCSDGDTAVAGGGIAIGVRINYSDATTEILQATPAVYGTVYSFSQVIAGVGKNIASIDMYCTGTSSNSNYWRGVIRKVRIATSAGVLREHIFQGGERRLGIGAVTISVTVGAFTGVLVDNSPGIGTNFPYSTTLRAFNGARSSRWSRISGSLYNKAALAGLTIHMSSSGTK